MNNIRESEDQEEVMGENHHNEDDPCMRGQLLHSISPFESQLDKPPWKTYHHQYYLIFMEKPLEDPNEFLFKFGILCRSYDYTSNEQNFKPFPATLKDNALHWFMSLGGGTVTTWDRMKQVFLEKYQEYWNTKDKREELFKMVQKDKFFLEDFIERLMYNV